MRLFLTLTLLLSLWTLALAESPRKNTEGFGFRYFRATKDQGNVVCSPLSLQAAFGMLALGAEGESRQEAWSVLGLDDEYVKNYSETVESLTPTVGQLSLASRLWPSNRIKLKPAYNKACEQAFGASAEPLNYGHPESARKRINEWTSKRTQGLIEELIPPRGIDSTTALVLSNALYFKGQWQHPFREELTKPGTFHAPDKKLELPFMNSLVPAAYRKTENYIAVSLPYEGSDLAMAFIMPSGEQAWQQTRADLNSDFLLTLEKNGGSHGLGGGGKIQLTLPKFKVRQESRPLDLLRSIGLKQLLSSNPQLTALSDSKDLRVSDCFHQAVVEVDEKGTKAAAATAIVVTRSMPRVKATVVIDRPFFFAIYQRSSGAPLFLGQVTHPE